MARRQDTEISALIAEALQLDGASDVRPVFEPRQYAGALEDRLQAMGDQLGLSYLRRILDADGLKDAIRADTAPLVLIGDAQSVVVTGVARSGNGASVVRVDADGTVVKMEGEESVVLRMIAGHVGRTPVALAPVPMVTPGARDAGDGYTRAESDRGLAAAPPRPARNVFLRVAQLLSRDRRDIVLLFVFAALAGLFALTLPLSVGAIVQLVQGGLILQPVVILIGYVVIGTLASGVLQVKQLVVVERIQQRVFARLALEYTFRIPRIRYETALQEDLPETMNRLFEAVSIQKSLSKFLLDTSTAILTVLAGLVLLTFYHPYFTFFGLFLLVVLGSLLWISGPRGLDSSLMESKYKYRAVHWLEEQARAFHAFKFAGRSAIGVGRMDAILTSFLEYRRKHFKVLMHQTMSIVAFRTIVVGGFLILGTQLVIDRQITLGQFVASELVIVTVLMGVEKLILSMSTIYDILTSAEKAGYVSDLPLDAAGGTMLPVTSQGMAIELREVSYRYESRGRDVLRSVSTRIAPGERVGIAGFKGSGRTTLLKLMAGLLTEYRGTVLVDGQPLPMLHLAALHEQIGQFLSSTDLFDGTVAENIAVGRRRADDSAVREAIADVGLTRAIEEMHHGLETQITHGGRRLSQGTAAKLLLAQATVGSPRLLVIDDLFQNLQGVDRQRFISLMADQTRNWTVVAVSHDPVLLGAMDRVLVLEDGGVRASAPLRELTDDPYVQLLFAVDGQPRVPREGTSDA